MSRRSEKAEHGRRLATRIRAQLGDEIREARRSAAVSQRGAASAAAMSGAQFGRIERAEIAGLSIDQAARAAAAVGLRIAVRTYPDGDPVRDAGQLALLERFRRHLPPAARWATEVPLPIPGDLRAWDGLAVLAGRRAGCEAEMRLRDVQAVDSRIALKERDGEVDVVILVVADTAANRRALEAHRDALRPRLPLDGRDVLAALRGGVMPARSGIVVL